MRIEKNSPAYISGLLAAAAEPTRLRILNLLGTARLCVCQLQQVLGLPEPTVSRHLARLRSSHLVTVERLGQRHRYGLAASGAPGFSVLRRFLADICRKEDCLKRDLKVLRQTVHPHNHPGLPTKRIEEVHR
jgi:ArsR family transcriptional regulator